MLPGKKSLPATHECGSLVASRPTEPPCSYLQVSHHGQSEKALSDTQVKSNDGIEHIERPLGAAEEACLLAPHPMRVILLASIILDDLQDWLSCRRMSCRRNDRVSRECAASGLVLQPAASFVQPSDYQFSSAERAASG